jgi:hypothetical protein
VKITGSPARTLLQFLQSAGSRVTAVAKATGSGRLRAAMRILRHGFTNIPEGSLKGYLLEDLEIERVDRLDENTVSIALASGAHSSAIDLITPNTFCTIC